MDPQIGRIFAEEARRRIDRVEALVAEGVPPPHTPERDELWRHMHSLKGTAESLGFLRIGELSEDIALRIAPDGAPALRELPPEEERVVRSAVDELDRVIRDMP